MKLRTLIIIFFITPNLISQVTKDMDLDGIQDSISYDANRGVIICKLSSQNFNAIYSQGELSDEMNAGVQETKSGFEFVNNYMRAGYASQFRYEPKEQKVRLIGMSRYEFGPASNDGSGKSSVNLLTNNYIGEWYHYDMRKEKLVKMPVISTKMYFPTIYLEDYNGNTELDYGEKCSSLYYLEKKKM